ncbi:MAG: hypothetical protein ACKO0N_15915, partial [Planctomycetota bacterium]
NLRRPTPRQSRDKRPAYQAAGSYRARLLMLIGLLLFVIILMSEARKPENYHWLTKLQGKNTPPTVQPKVERPAPRSSVKAPSGMKIVDITDSMPNRSTDSGEPAEKRPPRKREEQSESQEQNQELSAGALTSPPEITTPPENESELWEKLLSGLDSSERLTLFQLLRLPVKDDAANTPADLATAKTLLEKLNQKISDVYAAELVRGEQAPQTAALLQFKTDWDASVRPSLAAVAEGQTLDGEGEKKLAAARDRIYRESIRLIQDASEVARPSDSLAWLLAWQKLLNSPLGATTPVTPFELMTQPRQFRGRPVSFSGTLRGIETAPANREELGLSQYYVLWIQPKELDRTPYCVYAAELPSEIQVTSEGFQSLRQAVTIRGIFWKVRSYVDTTKDVATCPLVLARNVIVAQAPAAVEPYRWKPPAWLLWAITFLLPLVALAIAWRIYQTGREFVLPRSPGRTRSIEESLNQLSSDESIETDRQRLARLESSDGEKE